MKLNTLKRAVIFLILATPAFAPAAAPAATPTADPCANLVRCFNAGNFTAEVLQLTASNMQGQRHHTLKINVRFRNVTDQPLILGYHAGSSAVTDNLGNSYVYGRPGTHDTSVQGIGVVESQKADPQFQLAPGQTRNATFQVIRFNAANTAIGSGFNYDVSIDELTVLSGGQAIRTVRSNSMSFPGLGTNMPAAALAAGPGLPTPDQVAHKLLDHLLKKQ